MGTTLADGLQLVGEVPNAGHRISAEFRGIQLQGALDLLSKEIGAVPVIEGDTLRFVAAPADASRPQANVPGLLVATRPAYPAEALDRKIGGKVVLLLDVAADGSVTEATVESSEPAGVFNAAALDAAKGWKFDTKAKDQDPLPGRRRVPVTFDPRQAAGAAAGARS